ELLRYTHWVIISPAVIGGYNECAAVFSAQGDRLLDHLVCARLRDHGPHLGINTQSPPPAAAVKTAVAISSQTRPASTPHRAVRRCISPRTAAASMKTPGKSMSSAKLTRLTNIAARNLGRAGDNRSIRSRRRAA